MSDDPDSRLRDYLENCKIPLSVDDWIGFRKELENQKLETTYLVWIESQRKWFDRLYHKNLDGKRVNDSLILALNRIETLKVKSELWDKVLKRGSIDAAFREEMEDFARRKSKQKRDRKPKAPFVVKNWLEPMPVFNEGQPCGYVQATGQRRKVVENFLRGIGAKSVPAPSSKKSRGKPKQFFGFETNCRVLNQWLGTWCDQHPEAKLNLITREALMLADTIADSKNPINGERLARLRRIFRVNAKDAARQLDEYAGFDFLASLEACAAQIKELREKHPPAVKPTGENTLSAYLKQVLADEPVE